MKAFDIFGPGRAEPPLGNDPPGSNHALDSAPARQQQKDMKTNSDERKLVTAAASGDRDAFCTLYDMYKMRLYRYAFYRLGDPGDAEDAVSECFLSAWRQIGSLRDPLAFGGWMFTILSGCCNRMISEQIVQRQRISLDDPEAGDRLELPSEDDTEDVVERSVLMDALAILSEEDRSILLLSIVGGFKSREIAEITGLRPGSVRSRLSRNLAKVRSYLEDAGETDR